MADIPKKEDPERQSVIQEFDKMINLVQSSNETKQMTVGHGINMASSSFLKSCSNIESFKKLSHDEKIQYLQKFGNMENELAKKDPLMSMGFNLFKKWLVVLIQSDFELIERFSNKLAHFCKKAEKFPANKDPEKQEQGTPSDSEEREKHEQGEIAEVNDSGHIGESKDNITPEQKTYTFENDDKYIGEVNDNLFHGQGTYIWKNEDKYIGGWVRGKRHGQGTQTWPSGAEYVGEWKNDCQHGHGVHTYVNGDKYIGEWEENRPVGGWCYYADGEKKWSYMDPSGKWIQKDSK